MQLSFSMSCFTPADSFEVSLGDQLLYSKLNTGNFPDAEQVCALLLSLIAQKSTSLSAYERVFIAVDQKKKILGSGSTFTASLIIAQEKLDLSFRQMQTFAVN